MFLQIVLGLCFIKWELKTSAFNSINCDSNTRLLLYSKDLRQTNTNAAENFN